MPCTAVNLVLAVGAGMLVAVGGRKRGLRRPAAVAVAALTTALATLVIVLRGYLVPGTPWLTRTYFPDRVLQWFEKKPRPEYGALSDERARPVDGADEGRSGSPQADVDEGADGDEGTDVDEGADTDAGVDVDGGADMDEGTNVDGTAPGAPFDVETRLTDAGVIEEDPDGEDLRLTSTFHEAWTDRMVDLADPELRSEQAAAFLGLDPSALTVTTTDRSVTVSVDGTPRGRWESETALVADLAADHELSLAVDEWSDVPLRYRSSILQGLRAFLDDCPACGGPIATSDRPVDSCCRGGTVTAVRCADCGTRIAEIAPP